MLKINIKIEYQDGESETFTTCPPDIVKWERQTGRSIRLFAEEWTYTDLLQLAHNVLVRERAGKQTLPFDTWMLSVSNVSMAEDNPKAMN